MTFSSQSRSTPSASGRAASSPRATPRRRHSRAKAWSRHVADVAERHEEELAALPEADRVDRLCELNVIDQAENVCETTIVRDAWARGDRITVHGLVYGLRDGLLRDLGVSVSEAGAADGR